MFSGLTAILALHLLALAPLRSQVPIQTAVRGQPSYVAPREKDVLVRRIHGDAVHQGQAMTCFLISALAGGAHFRPDLIERARLVEAGLAKRVAFLGGRKRASYTGTGLWANHAYTVWGVSEEGGRRYVHLRDPFGRGAKGIGARALPEQSGVFKVPLESFTALYEDLYIGT